MRNRPADRRITFCPKKESEFSTQGTFTFTLNCHLGKTHSHRSRGDTTWEAQSAAHTHTDPRTPHIKVVKEKAQGGPAHYLLTFTDLARANVLRVGRCAYAPVPHRIWLSPGPPCGETRHGNERAVSSNSAVAPVVASVVLTFTQMSSHVGLFTRPAGQIPSSIGKVLNCLRAQLSIIMGYVTRTR